MSAMDPGYDLTVFAYLCLAPIIIGFSIIVYAVVSAIRQGLRPYRPGERPIEKMGDSNIPAPRDGIKGRDNGKDDDEPYRRSRWRP